MSREKGLALVQSLQSVSRETEGRLSVYHDLLKAWQPRVNLIAPSTADNIWERHIADSVQCWPMAQDARSLVDLGSGAGFPGMVCAILMAETATESAPKRIEFVESSGKKCSFLNTVVRETGLKDAYLDVTVHNGRIEGVLSDISRPDVITARALAPLKDLLRLTEGFLTGPSTGVFPKGRNYADEITDAERDWTFDWVHVPSRFDEDAAILAVSNVQRK